ncbi:antiviral reverse transcriptase Drt3b [Segatella albensis]|uniref:antiviral reverse transcriptase Drt3b n=1 Tax=Segatella albensis TaxID=77768 RepID=UPI000403D6B2|nr:antiviral reverse transcriptase Drt3b [Segatella albensis]
MSGGDALNNKYRVLLTEVLPYELPIMLNNEAFYQNMLDDETRKVFEKTFDGVLKSRQWSIPFDYSIRRIGGEKSRRLSLIHPLTQLGCVVLYEKYDDYMLSLCSRSPFSIRYIDKKARCIFPAEDEQQEEADDNRIELTASEIDPRYRSYFSYKKYDLMYKFFDSGDNLRLEQKYSQLMKLDISCCFYHIYTHSVAWAIKGKEFAKEHTDKNVQTFEKDFDSLMQHVNYNETNGIVVGPEMSRIFAEIILQRVDIDILERLKTQGLTLGKDYEVRRYVDDSYVYANSKDILDKIRQTFADELSKYKLDINTNKLEYASRPFGSDINDAKDDLRQLLKEFRATYLKKDDDGKYTRSISNEMKVFSRIANDFRTTTHKYSLTYGTLNKYFLAQLLRQIRSEKETEAFPSTGLLLTYVEIAMYVFSLDMHTTASYRLCSILQELSDWTDSLTECNCKQELQSKVCRELKRVLDIYENTNTEANSNLEVQNILLLTSRLYPDKLSSARVLSLFGITDVNNNGYDKLDYFQICTLLYVFGALSNFRATIDLIETELKRRFDSRSVMKRAEMAMLFFDCCTCPYISKATKLELTKVCTGCASGKEGERLREITKPGRWFFDWDRNHKIDEILMKKEYHSPYE